MTRMTAPRPDDTSRRLTEARRALDAERPGDARDLMAAAVAESADAAEAWLLLARAEAALGEAERARASFEKCLALAPNEPTAWLEYALFEAVQARGGAVVKRARQAGLPQALVRMMQGAATGRGTKAQGAGAATRADLAALTKAAAAGDLRQVEARAAPLLRTRAGAAVWGLLGQARLGAGQAAQAAEAFRQGVRLEPYAIDLRLGLARALAGAGNQTGALLEARRALHVAPISKAARLLLGRISLQAGLAPRALSLAELVLAAEPAEDAARVLAAEAAMQCARDAAVSHAEARAPGAPGREMLLARTLERAGRLDEAMATYDRMLDAAPRDAAALTARGQLRQTLGDAEGAEADLRAAIALRPEEGTAFRALAYGMRLAPDDEALTRTRAIRETGDLAPAAARLIDYGLARALQAHEPAAARSHLESANAAMLRAYPHDGRPLRESLTRTTQKVWPLLRDAQASGAQSACDAAPIFVTGLPRSGTTLVEAILSSHPEVAAGGELAVLRRCTARLGETLAAGEPATSALLTSLGADYAEEAARIAKPADGSLRLTDKSIYSFLEIGVIAALLPRARIVVVERDPRDTGLSIWRNHFRDGTHRYAASQEGIAEQIELFRDAIAFWQAAVPDRFHRIGYEDLLDDPEGQARALLAACDLTWDARVLAFHDAADRVATLSFAQVRQPLYTSSRGGWRQAAEEIAPLISALGDRGLLPKEDGG